MTTHTTHGERDPSSAPTPGTPVALKPSFLEWLPWEKILIWGLFLTLVYSLRHFFFIIFMTFILTYIMRGVVGKVSATLWPRRENIWLERVLTVALFGLFILGLYGAGSYLGPRLIQQAEVLVDRVTLLNPVNEYNNLVAKTVGAYIFSKNYGHRGTPAYEEAFEQFHREGHDTIAYGDFSKLVNSLDKNFENDERERIEGELKIQALGDKAIDDWFARSRSPAIYEKDPEKYRRQWEQKYTDSARVFTDMTPLEELKKNPEFPKIRDEQIHNLITAEAVKDAKRREEIRADWQEEMLATRLAAMQSTQEYPRRFEQFYETIRRNPGVTSFPELSSFTYSRFLRLREAHAQGPQAFTKALLEGVEEPATEAERLAQARTEFEYKKQREFAAQWLQTPLADRINANLADWVESSLKGLGGWIRDGIKHLITIPVQLSLSLLLSFFITLDVPRLRRGLRRLKKSRIRDFYEEIAPGLYNFGKLIGRAFQAQGVIALFNTILTFIAISMLGIKNEVFLCTIVFVCSFIPILGVVLSSIPIAIVAIVQRDGSIFLALYAIGAILVIHFIETSVLNPKILGDMLHLHPVAVLAVLAIGEHFFGVWGLLLGVPVAVYIFRCVILNESIPGLIEPHPGRDDEPPLDPGAGEFRIEAPGDAKRRIAVGVGAPAADPGA